MSRIRKFYESRFRLLAAKFGIPEDEFVIELFSSARKLSERENLGRYRENFSLAKVHAKVRQEIGETSHFPEKFLCDAGLGGLARWLRAAGYESIWRPGLDDAGVIREAQKLGATLVTTDTMMMERGVLRDGLTPSICVPSSLTCEEQMEIVFGEMALVLREPRCMNCGGKLLPVSKELVAGRIPPRTALWINDYFLCDRCNQLFWHGTHWRKITEKLQTLAVAVNFKPLAGHEK